MGSGNKFSRQREYDTGKQYVDVGWRSNTLTFRVHGADGQVISLDLDGAYDLADVLDKALAEHEMDPLS